MARIKRTDYYEINTNPTADDYVIGTDPNDSDATKNYRIGDIVELAGGSSVTFLGLTDTPDSYTGQSRRLLSVTSEEDGVEFVQGGLIPAGGSPGQVLTKSSTTNFSTLWSSPRDNLSAKLGVSIRLYIDSRTSFVNFSELVYDTDFIIVENFAAAPDYVIVKDSFTVRDYWVNLFANNRNMMRFSFNRPSPNQNLPLYDNGVNVILTPSVVPGVPEGYSAFPTLNVGIASFTSYEDGLSYFGTISASCIGVAASV